MKSKCTFKIEECGEGEYYGCMVDGDNKMLLKNFVVTHNSYFTAQKIIYKMVTEKGIDFSSKKSKEGSKAFLL
jgi:hypothetical protein